MARNKGRRAPQQQQREEVEPMVPAPTYGGALAPLQPRGYVALGEAGWAAGVRLQEATAALRDLEQQRAEEVARLRGLGASWAVVGWLVGTSGEGARKRWSTCPATFTAPGGSIPEHVCSLAAGHAGDHDWVPRP